MSPWLADCTFRQWLKAVVRMGQGLLSKQRQLKDVSNSGIDTLRTSRDILDIIATDEDLFCVAVNKALEWGKELARLHPPSEPIIRPFVGGLHQAGLIRDMREHDIDYVKRDGKKQDKYVHVMAVNGARGAASVDGTSTIICDDGYFIAFFPQVPC